MLAKNIKWLWLSFVIIVLDQVSKYWALKHLIFQTPRYVWPFLDLRLNFNPGAAFSFLSNQGGWQIYLFRGISAVVSVILAIWLLRLNPGEKLKAFGLSLIIGGAIGNLIDRMRLSYVIDFFDFHWHNWHYATFNVADSAVCVGAFFLILALIWDRSTV